MGKSLKDLLIELEEREDAGSISADRFDYQKDWALLRLLGLHRKDGDYVLLCEFHEDIAVIDDPNNPTALSLFQVKTSEKGNWSVNKLVKQKPSKAGAPLPSILGKLCGRAKDISGGVVDFHIVTTTGFSAKDGKSKKIMDSPGHSLASKFLEASEWKELNSALHVELGIDLTSALQETLVFAVAELPLRMHPQAVSGELSSFLEEYAPGSLISPAAFYRTLFDELRRITVAKKPSGASFAQVCAAKGVDRKKFDRMLAGAVRSAPHSFPFKSIDQELHRDGVSLGRRLDLGVASKSYYVRSLRSNDAALRSDRRVLVSAAENALRKNPELRMLELAEVALEHAKLDPIYGMAELSDSEALVLVMVEIYERSNDEIPTSNSQLKEESA
ncbi:DUF4297 domain-containing protein [Pseudoxanthomonas japonensis]|uniref:DUF4297 domain-containing protein n=1 Tax=Pseudoxanthomonas japonensis TaxID=69284 RepID=UPI00374923C0